MDTEDSGLECLMNVASLVSPAPPKTGVWAGDTHVLPAEGGGAL